MASIFVSYRHGRSERWAAGRLEEALAHDFDVFFDTEIRGGEPWRNRLLRELAECRVFIAVVGPEWRGKRNLERLRDPEDWVRKEILAALARKGSLTIVPVLIEAERHLDATALPEELRPLLEYQTVKLTHKNWKSDVDVLLATLRSSLSGSASRQEAAPVPLILPQLCDRVEAEQRLGDVVGAAGSSGTQTLALVLQGHKAERHGGFLERLLYNGELEGALRAKATGVGVHHLEWNGEYARQLRFDALLGRTVKKQTLGDSNASDERLTQFLASSRQALVFVLQVTWFDYRQCGERLLEDLVAAWHKLFAAPGAATATAGTPAFPRLLWINLSYDSVRQKAKTSAIDNALLELGPIEERHIQEWLDMPAVRPYVMGRETPLRQIAADPQNWFEKRKLHMEQFEARVRQILELA